MKQTNATGRTWTMMALSYLLATMAVVGLVLAGTGGPARATTTFTVTNTNDSGAGSLRRAILDANNTPGADKINFNIVSDARVKTISPTSALPNITGAVFIDGYSQPGAAENTLLKGTDAKLLIELDGTKTSGNGLNIEASDVEVQGLVINDFAHGIEVEGGSSVKIEGNFIGTNPAGTRDQGNRFNGVNVFESRETVIGGAPRTAHNLISGNDKNGVEIFGSTGNSVLGNLIGTQRDGTSALGNAQSGVEITDSSSNLVGNSVSGMPNTIAFNAGDGVRVSRANTNIDTLNNSISDNSIFSNGGLGIDLVGGTENATGATANDLKDPDSGANDLQNKPIVTSATTSSNGTAMSGKLNSVPGEFFVVLLYSNSADNEGKKLLAGTNVATDADGNSPFFVSTAQRVAAGRKITATAITPGGNTSEFSAPRTVVAQ